MIDNNKNWNLLQGSRYPEIIQNSGKIMDNEAPEISDRNHPVNKSQNEGSGNPEFRLTRAYCSLEF